MSLTQDSLRAHGGAVLAIAAQGGRVWTSGSDMGGPTLREWSATGKPGSSVALGAFGTDARQLEPPTCLPVLLTLLAHELWFRKLLVSPWFGTNGLKLTQHGETEKQFLSLFGIELSLHSRQIRSLRP